ncbi:hypothetical protein BDY19DRAFT_931939 [Irpex rosettiformis]|uniref:Uncharacterized protein n=1 Tax=Irpex rosettiformis TaxID=378272 RepID=A0ACB8UBT8_9APHY|nr:hypothetical protein BDY19DRAFT_931939 [Irpex rosettiformis]
MDDLYGNAWGDSADVAGDIHLPHTTWTASKLPTHNEEADLAAPSWSTGSGIQWNAPSQDTRGFRWSANDPDLAWTSDTTLQDTSIQSSDVPEDAETPSIHPSQDSGVEREEQAEDEAKIEHIEPQDDYAPVSSPIVASTSFVSSELDSSLKPPLSSPSFSRSSSPDGFGTFETGFESTSRTVPEKLSPGIADEENWGSPWVGTEQEEDAIDSKPVDEWEVARQQKEQLDRKIPPEVLANILAQCTEFFQDPKHSSDSSKDEDNINAWMNQWRSGLDTIDGLESLIHTIVPDLTLQPAPQFTKTAIAKNMASSVRLTKNLPLAKSSPLSLYFATKGSTAWETAVKERKLVIEEDVVPAGWRILEKAQVTDTLDSAKSTRQSGFFSFWGRRHSKTPSTIVDSPTQSLGSLSRPSSVVPVDYDVASKRTSHEATSPAPSSSKESIIPVTPTSETRSPSSSTPEEIFPPQATLYADAPDLAVDKGDTPPPLQAPPSAVSRFLHRFSRTRSAVGSPSPRSSLALSSDDLDVLSDIVPSVHDGFEDDGDDVPSHSLAKVLKSEPLAPVLPPPPIAPPIRSQLVTMSGPSSLNGSGVSHSTESTPAVPIPNSDLDDLFGAFETVSMSSRPSVQPPAIDDFDIFSSALAKTKASPTTIKSLVQSSRDASPHPFPVLDSSTPISQPIPQQPNTSPSTPVSRPNSSLSNKNMLSFHASNDSSGTRTLQPKLPLSLSLPPPPSVDLMAPPLSASEVPLAKLYPSAVGKGVPAFVGATSNISRSSSMSPSLTNSGPRKRNTTPIMVDKPSKPSVAAPLLPPPPSFAAPPVASNSQMQNFFGDDDDDFADFQSPSEPIAPASLPLPSSESFSFALPPPPASHGTSAPIATPTPVTSIALLTSTTPSTPPPQTEFKDDFSTFFSSSSTQLQPQSSLSSGFDSSLASASDKSFFSSYNGSSNFNEFIGSPSSSALRTPSPPRPIEKSPKPLLSIKPPPQLSTSRMSDETRNRQHQHTLSLMERAAARPGRWPAPPSPLPQALTFPAPGSATQSVDLMEDDDAFGDFSTSPTVSPKNDFLLPPPTRVASVIPTSTTPLFGLEADSKQVPQLSMPPLQSVKKQGKKGSGGLSAQDLSFFEGL